MTEELSSEQLNTLIEQLKTLALELRELLSDNKGAADPVKLDQQLMGRVSRIDAIQQQNMATANRANQERRLKQVNQALRLVDTGDYGYCRQCDKLIGYGRLTIKPEATLCIKCQSATEQSP